MTRDELLNRIQLQEELIPSDRPNRPGTAITVSSITIHNTSNKNTGADAAAHSRFVRQTGYYEIPDGAGGTRKNWVSWHFTVDDHHVIQHLPTREKALHAGNVANNSSIAIEICMNAGIDQAAANEKAAQLAALLCHDHAVPVSTVFPHKKWTGKNCPEQLLAIWDAFQQRISYYLAQINREEALSELVATGVEMASPVSLCWNQSCEPNEPALVTTGYDLQTGVSEGFNESFLAAGLVGLPVLTTVTPVPSIYSFVHHQNMTTCFHRSRMLALYTACNYDKTGLFESVNRSNAFRIDPQVPAELQLGEGFYKSSTLDISASVNYFDRGHIIARRYNQWGETKEEAIRGERDTYFFTTILPQVRELNQEEWEDLESFIIERGKLKVEKISVIAGALLLANDPVATYIDKYERIEKTIQIPVAFWKIVYYEVNGELRKIAFLMSQRNRLREIDFIQFPPSPELAPDPFDSIGDPLKTYIINSRLIEEKASLQFAGASEKFQQDEPLEAVLVDNETHPATLTFGGVDISNFI